MKRLILLGVSVAAALSVAASSANAELIKKKKRPSLLENLFGASSFEGNSRERNLRKPRRNWWEQGGGFGFFRNDEYAWERQGGPAAFIDPEEVEGYGMGNLTYALPKTQAVYDASFGKLSTSETAPSFIRLALSDKETAIRASDTVRKIVLEHYRSTGFKPLWTEKGTLSPRGEELLQVFAKAGEEGLNPERYLPAVLSSFVEADQQIAHDGVALAQLDVGLTVSALTYARHLSGGAFEPQLLSRYYDISPEYADPAVALKVLAYSPYPASYLKGLAPTHPAYGAMKAELAALMVADKKVRPFPAGKRVKIGQQDERIPRLRARLEAEGFVPDNAADIGDEAATTFDKHLAKALKAYQQAKNIGQTGQLDQNTVRALNGGESRQGLQEKLIVNMERLRWLPKNLGYRHVLVNQAAFTVKVMENGKSAWTSKVIVGKPMTQTAVFSDEMETVVFNPTWGVPQSILLNEYLPKLRRDPSYLDRIGFQVVNADGRRVSSRAVNWYAVGSGSGIGVVQPPGGDNALGEIKFLFPNSHSIYMHDTPNRELFAESQRSFSHGCVRVENPREFAQVLLKWEAEKVAGKVATGETSSVKITNPVKVHLTYFTAWPDDSGKIHYFSDIYGRDEALVQALRSVAERFARKPVPKLVQNANSQPAVKID